MTKHLPKFDAPPVIETVLSIQFSRFQNFSNAHAGWFWKNYLDDEHWISVQETPRLPDQFERFGEDKKWAPKGGTLSLRSAPVAERLQIIRDDEERMIQIQDSRFIYNWRKGAGQYPSYDQLLPEFKKQFEKFEKFALDSGNPPLSLNQWEVTYVNHIPIGELWSSAGDWPQILTGLYWPPARPDKQKIDTLKGAWSYILGDNLGRLHITLEHVRLLGQDGQDILSIQLTARGPLESGKIETFEDGFNLGHESIVLSFADITSELAHTHWKRTK